MAAERSAGRDSPRLGSAPRPPLPGTAERARRLPRRAGGGGCGRAPPRRVDGGRRCRGAAPPADSAAEPPGRVPPGPPLLGGAGQREIPPPDGCPRWARPPHMREAGCGPARRGQLLLVLPHGSPALAQALRGGGTGAAAHGGLQPPQARRSSRTTRAAHPPQHRDARSTAVSRCRSAPSGRSTSSKFGG